MTEFSGKYVYINEYRSFLLSIASSALAHNVDWCPVFSVIANKAEKLHRQIKIEPNSEAQKKRGAGDEKKKREQDKLKGRYFSLHPISTKNGSNFLNNSVIVYCNAFKGIFLTAIYLVMNTTHANLTEKSQFPRLMRIYFKRKRHNLADENNAPY